MVSDATSPSGFSDLGLIEPILKTLDEVGYETPSPIQAQIIPSVLAGRDVIGQAQTGTGKTAAFALPLLSRIDLDGSKPSILVLAPTRELAIQVAEAFQRYAGRLKGFHVLPIYGGQGYTGQLRQLKRGVHVVVGTPGRVMDHMRRGTLKLDGLKCLVLDEADEMLRMGFIEDVEWILEQTPPERQTALFSATMPRVIRRIADRHLRDPAVITIEVKTTAAETIRQRYWEVGGYHKLDALTRILEVEPFDGMIVFVRTKIATVELAEKLEARGFSTAALNGDIAQNTRERTLARLKSGDIDILVATDVAARGLDVERISHVINYDIPYDVEAYVHRIGRTGRAGRGGDAILFVAPRERRLLRSIEKALNRKIEILDLPSIREVNDRRISRFKQRITAALADEEVELYQKLIAEYQEEHEVTGDKIAAALAKLIQGDEPLLLAEKKPKKPRLVQNFDIKSERPQKRPRGKSKPEIGMARYRFEAGLADGVKPGNIVGAIANETGLESKYIGRIDLFDHHGTVDLPEGMPREAIRILKKVWVAGRPMKLSKWEDRSKYADFKKKPKTKKIKSKKKPGKK